MADLKGKTIIITGASRGIGRAMARAVFICSRAVLPFLKKSVNPHILSLSPPINLDTKWFKDHAPYTLSK